MPSVAERRALFEAKVEAPPPVRQTGRKWKKQSNASDVPNVRPKKIVQQPERIVRQPDKSSQPRASARRKQVVDAKIIEIDDLASIKTNVVMALGQTGHGKSSLCNTLLNCTKFKESARLKSCTTDLKILEGHWFGDILLPRVTVIDTPGFLDSENRDSENMEALIEYFANFPIGKLSLIIIPLPLTEIRAKSTYFDLIEQVELLFGEKALQQTVFVTTMENQLNPRLLNRISNKKNDWKTWVEANVEGPVKMCNYHPANSSTIMPVYDYYQHVQPFTPVCSEEIEALLASNKMTSIGDVVQKVEQFNTLQTQMENKIAQQLEQLRQTTAEIKQCEEHSARLDKRLAEVTAQVQETEQRYNAMPKVRYIHIQCHCLDGDSLASVKVKNSIVQTPISTLKEGQFVATLNDDGEIIWTEIYFVEHEKLDQPEPMLRIHYQSMTDSQSGSVALTSGHLIFAQDKNSQEKNLPGSSTPVVASSIECGDILYIADPQEFGSRPVRVVNIDQIYKSEMWTVLVKEHRFLVNSVLLSSHVINQAWGIADNAILLFIYNHFPWFATSKFNKWICRKWDSIFEPLATKFFLGNK